MLDLPTPYEGRSTISSLLQMVQSKVTPFTFRNIIIYDIADSYQIFVEYESEAVIKATGRLYIHKYASRMVVDEHG
jgi:hypothetical protein